MSAFFSIRLTLYWRQFAICALLLSWGGLSAPGQAAADNIDDALLEQTPSLIKNLQDRGYNKVGVLTFLLQHGESPSQFRGATICNSMPARVENAMVLKMSSKQPQFMILPRATSVVAAEISGASYRSADDRRRLFSVRFPQAWGNEGAATADAFVCGKVKVSSDKRNVTVSIAAFDREKMFDILEFDVKMDRYILAEVGQGFSLTKARLRGVKLRGMTDDAIFDSLDSETKLADSSSTLNLNKNNTDSNTNNTNTNNTNTNNNSSTQFNNSSSGQFPVQLTVFYDNELQYMQPDSIGGSSGSNNYSLPEPQEGQSLTFGLVNVTDGPLCAVLMVNGVSTLYEQTGQPNELNKWILDPGKEYRVKGYHQQDGSRYFAITTLSEQESKDKYEDLGGDLAAGLIQLYVFTPVGDAKNEILAYTRSIGRMSRKDGANRKSATFAEYQTAIAKKSRLYPPGAKPLAAAGQELNESIEEKKFGPIRLSDTMIVRYSSLKP